MIKGIIFDWVGTLYQFDNKGLFSYSEKVLAHLQQKYKLAVISMATPENLRMRRRQIKGVERYFKYVQVGLEKTNINYMDCMDALYTFPISTLVVDDRTIRGIKIGNDLGCKTAWIRNGKYANEAPNKETGRPTYIIDSVEDLLDIL